MDEPAITDLILKRYGSIDYILSLPYLDGLAQIKKAAEQEREQYIWEMWLAVYPYMNEKTFVPFSEYKAKHIKPKIQTEGEILIKVKLLNAMFGGKVVEA